MYSGSNSNISGHTGCMVLIKAVSLTSTQGDFTARAVQGGLRAKTSLLAPNTLPLGMHAHTRRRNVIRVSTDAMFNDTSGEVGTCSRIHTDLVTGSWTACALLRCKMPSDIKTRILEDLINETKSELPLIAQLALVVERLVQDEGVDQGDVQSEEVQRKVRPVAGLMHGVQGTLLRTENMHKQHVRRIHRNRHGTGESRTASARSTPRKKVW